MSRLTRRFDGKVKMVGCAYDCKRCDGMDCTYPAIAIDKLAHYEDLEEQGRLIITDEPRKPLIAGADTLYCPECGSDLMGGFPYTDDTEMFQCRYCGQWINEKEQPIKLAELKGTEE